MTYVVEDFVPYDRSKQWRLSQAYYEKKGVDAWQMGDIPYQATSSYPAARQYAGFLLDYVANLEAEGLLKPGDPVRVLELGAGPGYFASRVIRALLLGLGPKGRKLAARLTYVMTDLAVGVLKDASSKPHLKTVVKQGLVVPAVLNLCDPQVPRDFDGHLLPGPYHVVFGNYIADSVPAKRLKRLQDKWEELYLSLETTTEWCDWATAKTQDEVFASWLKSAGTEWIKYGVESKMEWRSTELDDVFQDFIHRRLVRRMTDRAGDEDMVTYPYAFVQFLLWSRGLLHPYGVYSLSDYGNKHTDVGAKKEGTGAVPYGNSLTNPVDFRVFDALAAEINGRCWQTRKKGHALNHLVLAMGKRTETFLQRCFQAWYVDCTDGQDFLLARKGLSVARNTNNHEESMKHLKRLIALSPHIADGYLALASVYLKMGRSDAAWETLLKVKRIPDSASHDIDFEFGRVALIQKKFEIASRHFIASYRRGPTVPAMGNLALAFEGMGRLSDAYRAHKRALALVPDHKVISQNLEKMRKRLGPVEFERLEAEHKKQHSKV